MIPLLAIVLFYVLLDLTGILLNVWTKCVSLLINSYPAVCDFLQHNNLLSVIRAHEAQDAGWVHSVVSPHTVTQQSESNQGIKGKALGVYSSRFRCSLNFERSRVNPRNENDAKERSKSDRCDGTSATHAGFIGGCGFKKLSLVVGFCPHVLFTSLTDTPRFPF